MTVVTFDPFAHVLYNLIMRKNMKIFISSIVKEIRKIQMKCDFLNADAARGQEVKDFIDDGMESFLGTLKKDVELSAETFEKIMNIQNGSENFVLFYCQKKINCSISGDGS